MNNSFLNEINESAEMIMNHSKKESVREVLDEASGLTSKALRAVSEDCRDFDRMISSLKSDVSRLMFRVSSMKFSAKHKAETIAQLKEVASSLSKAAKAADKAAQTTYEADGELSEDGPGFDTKAVDFISSMIRYFGDMSSEWSGARENALANVKRVSAIRGISPKSVAVMRRYATLIDKGMDDAAEAAEDLSDALSEILEG